MAADRNTLFLNHFHTRESAKHLEKYTDADKWKQHNHLGSPLLILDKLGKNQNAVITLTEHYATNGKKYFKKILGKNEEKGGKGSIKDKQVHLEKEGSKLKILNGVEASYKHESNHVIIAGLSTKEKEKYMLQNTEELKKALKKAEYAYPAHPFMPKAGIKKETLDEICQIIKKSEARLFTPFPAGYGPRYNKMARGLKNKDTDIYDLRRKYSAPLIPDHGHHIHLPSGKNGLGLLKNSSIEKEFPLKQIENSHIVKAKRSKRMQNLWRA